MQSIQKESFSQLRNRLMTELVCFQDAYIRVTVMLNLQIYGPARCILFGCQISNSK
jgi:hypothetical protein